MFGKTDKDTGRYSVQWVPLLHIHFVSRSSLARLDGTPVQVLNATSDAPQVNATRESAVKARLARKPL